MKLKINIDIKKVNNIEITNQLIEERPDIRKSFLIFSNQFEKELLKYLKKNNIESKIDKEITYDK